MHKACCAVFEVGESCSRITKNQAFEIALQLKFTNMQVRRLVKPNRLKVTADDSVSPLSSLKWQRSNSFTQQITYGEALFFINNIVGRQYRACKQ